VHQGDTRSYMPAQFSMHYLSDVDDIIDHWLWNVTQAVHLNYVPCLFLG